jgi:hypothetical protein
MDMNFFYQFQFKHFQWLSVAGTIIALLAISSAADTLRHEMGWDHGLKYARHFTDFNLGIRLSPKFDYSEEDSPGTGYSLYDGPDQAERHSNGETRELYTGIIFSKNYFWKSGVYIGPYFEPGYTYSMSESYTQTLQESANFTQTSVRNTEMREHKLSLDLGVMPGIRIMDNLNLYTRFGISGQVRWTRMRYWIHSASSQTLRNDVSSQLDNHRRINFRLGDFGAFDWTQDISLTVLF